MTVAQKILSREAWEANVRAAYQESLGLEMPMHAPLNGYPPAVRHWGVAVLREVAARRQDLCWQMQRSRRVSRLAEIVRERMSKGVAA